MFITSPLPNVTSYDVFLTAAGDVLIATGVPTRTSVPGEPGEFITHVELTVVGGFGKYAEATGTTTFDGRTQCRPSCSRQCRSLRTASPIRQSAGSLAVDVYGPLVLDNMDVT